jgi:patatin-like phospholipase
MPAGEDFIMTQTRRVLSCDGGGVRGIVTLRYLEELEKEVGPCYEYFDMFAGTSTGAFIAAALASGRTVKELIEVYDRMRKQVFRWRLRSYFHPLLIKYSKEGMRRFLREYFQDIRFSDLQRDIMITAVDTFRSETTYFSCFRLPDGKLHGAYQNIRLRDAVEASASAPTYFASHGRFIDGGCTVYNNPAYMAVVEALRYSSDREQKQASRYDDVPLEVYSFSTGLVRHAVEKGAAPGKPSLGWVKYVLQTGADHANYHQSYVAQTELDLAERTIGFHRYDLYICRETLRNAGVEKDIDPATLTLDAVNDNEFRALDRLGKHFGETLRHAGRFKPLLEQPPTSGKTQADLVEQHKRPDSRWVKDPRPQMPRGYADEVLDEFEKSDQSWSTSLANRVRRLMPSTAGDTAQGRR